ncbi:MAG: NDP-sugar synthase [Elusimicrobia bacterium]|nr:NDP-sugar synthase [Elusimicrobiota bacterium]
MKALILTGGQGLRLRPFTCQTPKPLLPVANLPFLAHQFALLRRHGIREAVVATAYRSEAFPRTFGDGRRFGLRIRYACEKSPLGTGGAVRNSAAALDPAEAFLVLNGDVLHDLDLTALLRAHRAKRAEASIALVRVKDPTLYGLVETAKDGRILRFIEKPSLDEISCRTVNAGAYVFEPSVVGRIPPGKPYSLERGLFPSLLEAGRPFYGCVTGGYWMDIGTVEKYLQVHLDILCEAGAGAALFRKARLRRRGAFLWEAKARLAADAAHEGDGHVLVGAGASVAPLVRFSGSVCIGPGCVVERGAWLSDCVILGRSRIGRGARLSGCVVGHACVVEPNASIGPGRALGDGSVVKQYSQL